jgi:hypothetical protein
LESLDASNSTTKDERVYVMGAFVGIDGFQIHRVTDDVILIRHTVRYKRAQRKYEESDGEGAIERMQD